MKKILLLVACLWALPALADPPCDKDAYGVSRTIQVTDEMGFLIGQYGQNVLGLKDKEVVLTFDDGPVSGSTEEILDILKKECIKASFLLVGKNAQAHPDIVRRIAREGHNVGFHSWSHKRFIELNEKQVEEEVSKGVLAVEQALAPDYRASNFFRFPYLDHNDMADRLVSSHGLVALGASWLVGDWTDISPEEIRDRTMEDFHKSGNGVLILHDVHERTAKALPLILESLKKEGYKIVQIVPEMHDAPLTPQTAPGAP